MKLRFTKKADKDYAGLPVIIRKAFGEHLRFCSPIAPIRHCARKNIAKRSTCGGHYLHFIISSPFLGRKAHEGDRGRDSRRRSRRR
jgi:hypothetical protein